MERDPLLQYTIEEIRNLTEEEFKQVINEHNYYVLHKKEFLAENNEKIMNFSSLEELLKYYDAISMEEAINNLTKLFD